MKTTQRLQALLTRYLSEQASADEQAELWTYVNDPVFQQMITEQIGDEFETPGTAPGLPPRQEQEILQHILGKDQVLRTTKLWPRIAAAASIVLVLGAGIFYYSHKTKPQQQTNMVAADIQPGGNKAFLTLANGKKISLTDAANGNVAQQGGVTITKTANGQITYETSTPLPSGDGSGVGINTIETPRGGQYQVQLPDGTKVWLNAESSLKYPASFASQTDRRVQLTGEAYFEVAKDKAHPFVVSTATQEVAVLGTHFNINSYADGQSIATTLLEGSVKVSRLNDGEFRLLKPGEQSRLGTNSISITQVDVDDAVAWKEGFFVFDGSTLGQIMQQVSRWYDVDVVYKDENLRKKQFSGSVSRFTNASQVLKKLELLGAIKYDISGKVITIRNKN